MALPDTAQCSIGFILFCSKGHESRKDELIQVCEVLSQQIRSVSGDQGQGELLKKKVETLNGKI